jgi:carbon-monoxide dehydrogenase small subunit
MAERFTLKINGALHEIACGPERPLLDALREDLGLTGTKRGCGIGACGSCTVLVDGKPKRSCRLSIVDVAGSTSHESRVTSHENSANALPSIITIEGLSDGKDLHPIQQAFIDCGAIQCGFCTPGMVLAAKALLDENPSPTRDEISSALRGNLCRCTGYQQIFEAVEEAAKKIKG